MLRAHQRVRLHRVAVPQGQGRPRHRLRHRHQRRRLEVQGRRHRRSRRAGVARTAGRRRRASSSSPTPSTCRRGKRTSTSSPRPTSTVDDDGNLTQERVNARQAGNFILAPRDERPVHRRLAEAARLGRGLAHPVPRERRREPRADGIEHAAPGGAAAARAGAVCRHRHGVHHRPRLGRGDRGAPVGHHRLRRQPAHRRARRERDGRRRQQGDGRRHLPDDEVQALQPEHLHHPEADRPGRPEGAQGAGAGRRSVHGARRARARPQRARRVHAVARLQLRGRDPRLRADGEGRLLHVDPHRGVRDRGARHQARAGRNHARHPERRRKRSCRTSTRAASSASAPT